MKKAVIGKRTIKTILAVIVAFSIANIIDGLSPAMMAAAAITAMNASIHKSFISSLDRFWGNITAVLLAVLLQVLNLVNPLGVGFGLLILVFVSKIFNWERYLGSAAIFYVFVFEVPLYKSQDMWTYSFNRISDTALGLGIGLLINTYIFRPRQEKFLMEAYHKGYIELRDAFKNLVEKDKTVDEVKLLQNVSLINELYESLRDEVKIKMNSNVTTVTVLKLNNLFRMAMSLIIELNDIEEVPMLCKENVELVTKFFKGDFEYDEKYICESNTQYLKRYNYEIRKIVYTLESIEYNIHEFSKMYQESENKWYLDTKK